MLQQKHPDRQYHQETEARHGTRAVHSSEALDEESNDGEISSKFISNVNTFPRICNIILDHPDALIRSALLASKYALQNKETNQSQPIFKENRENSTTLPIIVGELFQNIQK